MFNDDGPESHGKHAEENLYGRFAWIMLCVFVVCSLSFFLTMIGRSRGWW